MGTLAQVTFLYAAAIAFLSSLYLAIIVFLPLAVVFVLLNFLNLNFYLLYRHPIRESTLAEILRLNPVEWQEFARGVPTRFKLVTFTYGALSSLAIGWLLVFQPFGNEAGLIAGLIATVIMIGAWYRGFLFSIYPMKYFKQLRLVVTQARTIKRLKSDNGRNDIQIENLDGVSDEVFILVIGESVRRSNLSIYGYHRDTTPFLNSIKDELIVFDDAISAASITHAALKYALSPALIEDEAPLYKRKTLLNAAANAGFLTYWISNQPRDIVFDYLFEVVSEEAAHKIFINTDPRRSPLDEELLPFVFSAIEGPKPCLVVAHMFGSHFRYDRRISNEFRRFTNDIRYTQDIRYRDIIVDNYDNTILYLDHFLERVITACRDQELAAVVGFLSDHGEALFDNGRDFGHALVRPARKEFEVPYLYWASPEFKRRHPQNALFQVPPRVTAAAETQLAFEDLTAIIGLRYANVEIAHANLPPLGPRNPARRKILSHGRVFEFDSLPD